MHLAYIVDEGWQRETSGVATFIHNVHDTWLRDFDCEIIERPQPKGLPTTDNGQRTAGPGRDSGLRLALGYLKDLRSDIRWARSVKERLAGRLIVTNQFGCETLPIALRIAHRREDIVAIAHTHPGMDDRARHWAREFVEWLCYRSVSDIVYNSHSVRDEWQKKLGRSDMKGAVIWYGIPAPDSAVPEDYPQRQPGVVDFLCVSRFADWKGHIPLLVAWKRAMEECHRPRTTAHGPRTENVRMRLLLVGDGETLETAREFAAHQGLADSALFLGSKQDGARYFNGADVGVLLSIEPEAFGQVLLEAMSRGKPVIASNMGGIAEVVVDQETGLLVDPQRPAAVAAAIERLATAAPEREKFGENGLARWRTHFSLERMLRDYREYLTKRCVNGGQNA